MPGKHVPAQRSSAPLIHLTSSVWTTEVPEDLPAEIPEEMKQKHAERIGSQYLWNVNNKEVNIRFIQQLHFITTKINQKKSPVLGRPVFSFITAWSNV